MFVEEDSGRSVKEVHHSTVSSSCIEMESGLNCTLRMRWESVELAVTREVAGARNDLLDMMDQTLRIRLVAEW